MAKNHHRYILIKKAFKSIVFISALASFMYVPSITFATISSNKGTNISNQIRRIKNCASDKQMEQYIQTLSDKELKELYLEIYQKTSRKPHSLQLVHARQIISKTQAQREAFRITHFPPTFKSHKYSLTDPIKFTPKKEKLQSKPRQPKPPKTQQSSPITATKTTRTKMRTCKHCKRRYPILLLRTCTIRCEDCKKEIVGYVCQACLSNIAAGTIPNNKTTARKKCPECKENARATKLLLDLGTA